METDAMAIWGLSGAMSPSNTSINCRWRTGDRVQNGGKMVNAEQKYAAKPIQILLIRARPNSNHPAQIPARVSTGQSSELGNCAGAGSLG
jgi:hypothetical protein